MHISPHTTLNHSQQLYRRLGGRNGAVAPALGIKCTTAEIRAINEVRTLNRNDLHRLWLPNHIVAA